MHHDITFRNVTITDGQPWKITNAKNINFENVKQASAKDKKDVKKDTKKTDKKAAK